MLERISVEQYLRTPETVRPTELIYGYCQVGDLAGHRSTLPAAPQLDCEHDPPACRGRSVTPVGAGGRWPDPQLD